MPKYKTGQYLVCSRRSKGTAQSRQTNKKKRGWARGESEGTPVRLFEQKLIPLHQILVYLMIGLF